MKRKIKIIFTLLRLLYDGAISYNYFKNYDFKEQRILISGLITNPKPYNVLEFHSELELIGEDKYKVIGTDNAYVNSIITNPLNNGLYKFVGTNTSNTDHFELLIHS